MFGGLFRFLSTDLAIDLGTANTLVYAKGRGIVSNEPSIVAVHSNPNSKKQRRVVAVGAEAKGMRGKTPQNVSALRPLKDGVIADYEITEAMLRYFMRSVHRSRALVKPRVVICVPFGITEVEKRAVRESAESAGAREVFLIEEPMAAAIGAGLPISEPSASMVVDIGGGTTEVAVISLRGVVYSRSVRIGGDKLDEAIVNYIKRAFNVSIGETTAERIKVAVGAAVASGNNPVVEVRGRDMVTGLPKSFQICEDDVREAIEEPLGQILETVRSTLEHTPPELAGDIVDRGITLTGGGSLLTGIDALIRDHTGLPVVLAEDPLTAVVTGSGRVLDNENLLRDVTVH